VCEINFKQRGTWSTKEEDKQFVSAEVKDKNGELKYLIFGKYNKELLCTNISNG
jgi:hypothetical protein